MTQTPQKVSMAFRCLLRKTKYGKHDCLSFEITVPIGLDRENAIAIESDAWYSLNGIDQSGHLRVKPGLHSVRRTYATELRKRIYASHARRGVYTPRVNLGAYTQTSTQYRLRTISGRWIYFICRVKACVYA